MIRRPRRRRLLTFGIAALAALGITLGTAGPALAYPPVDIVHTEHVQAGPYDVRVGFSTWPIRAMQSLDFTFSPSGGIAGKSGTFTMTGPGVKQQDRVSPLVRHPRQPTSWGLDVTALNAPGTYTIGFDITGPQGKGSGTLRGLTVLAQPGPPLALSWVICSLPFVALVLLIAVAWRRVRPGRRLQEV